jgi:RHS repeat-associated protein
MNIEAQVHFQTAVPNISVAIGSTRELLPSEILNADSTDYLIGGALTLRNGRIDKYLFEEGYCQARKYVRNYSQDNFTFCYYDRDHLGNVRQVREANGGSDGRVIQTLNYYPFGAQLCDSTTDSNVQNHKYNGKEFDGMHGLNTYDYGARQYNPVTARWDRMDPLCEKYYSISPYAYCGNNPVMLVDLDGKEWTYVKDSNGNIIINVALNFSISENWTSEQISEYKNAISSQFNNMLSEASSGTVSGTITFYEGNSSILQSLSLGAFVDNTFGGHTEYFASSVNLYGKDGGVRAISSVASDAIHEMLHTLRLGHPFEVTQTADTELKRIDSKNFASTPSTDENIVNNIMSYPMIRVDGKSGDNQNHLTNGQLNFMLKEISLQNKGYGFFNYNKAFNNEQNTGIYKEYYENYWNNWPGTPVKNQ